MNRQFKTAKENGHLFDEYDYNYSSMRWPVDKAYFYAIEELNLPSEINIEVGDDGQNIVRISAVLENGKGYDFNNNELDRFLNSI